MTRLPASPRCCLPALALFASAPVFAQPIIPNPLVQPAAAAAAASAAAAAATPSAGPATAAGPAPGRGNSGGQNPLQPPPRTGGDIPPLPVDTPPGGAEPPSIPLAVQERVSGLYVAAIVDRAAVLRSQIAVPQMMFSSGALQGGAVPAGGQGSAGQSGGAGGAALAPAPVAGGGGGGGTVFRSATYVVRDGQVVDFIDRYRVLARVTRDTVVLYLMADKPGEGDRNKVVFRGSIDSVIAAPPTPSRGNLEAPDGGLDGKARRDLSNVDARSGGARPGSAAAPGSPNASPGSLPR